MIVDAEGIELPESRGVKLLRSSTRKFVLTGSYFFGCARGESDVDFMADYDGSNRWWLDNQGFKLREDLAEEFYKASEGNQPFAGTIQLWEMDKVQVQLVGDLYLKTMVRDIVKKHHYDWHLTADTKDRTRLWHAWLTVLSSSPIGLPFFSVFDDPHLSPIKPFEEL